MSEHYPTPEHSRAIQVALDGTSLALHSRVDRPLFSTEAAGQGRMSHRYYSAFATSGILANEQRHRYVAARMLYPKDDASEENRLVAGLQEVYFDDGIELTLGMTTSQASTLWRVEGSGKYRPSVLAKRRGAKLVVSEAPLAAILFLTPTDTVGSDRSTRELEKIILVNEAVTAHVGLSWLIKAEQRASQPS